jgi:hypothetical protein
LWSAHLQSTGGQLDENVFSKRVDRPFVNFILAGQGKT